MGLFAIRISFDRPADRRNEPGDISGLRYSPPPPMKEAREAALYGFRKK
jgi:hypothetical protein